MWRCSGPNCCSKTRRACWQSGSAAHTCLDLNPDSPDSRRLFVIAALSLQSATISAFLRLSPGGHSVFPALQLDHPLRLSHGWLFVTHCACVILPGRGRTRITAKIYHKDKSTHKPTPNALKTCMKDMKSLLCTAITLASASSVSTQ